jgi:hypothetical protein
MSAVSLQEPRLRGDSRHSMKRSIKLHSGTVIRK